MGCCSHTDINPDCSSNSFVNKPQVITHIRNSTIPHVGKRTWYEVVKKCTPLFQNDKYMKFDA